MVKIIEQTGRIAPDATTQVQPDRYLGNSVGTPVQLNFAPAEAFGDSSGQAAIGAAMQGAGSTLFNVAERKVALDTTVEASDIENRMTQYSAHSGTVRNALKEEQATLPVARTPDQIESEWLTRMAAKKEELFAGREYKYFADEFLQKKVGEIEVSRTTEFVASDFMENAKVNEAVSNTEKQVSAIMQEGTHAGADGDLTKAKSLVDAIDSIYMEPRNVAALGGSARAKAIALDKKVALVTEFVTEFAHKNPDQALALISDENGPLAQMLTEEELLPIQSDLVQAVKRVVDIRDQEVREAQGKVAGDLEWGIYNPDPKTGRRTTFADIKRAEREGRISPDQAAEKFRMLRAEYDRAESERNTRSQKQIDQAAMLNVLNNGGSFMGSGLTQSDQDNLYEGIVNSVSQTASVEKLMAAGHSREDALQIQEDQVAMHIGRAGIMPTNYKALIEGNIRSADPARSARAVRSLQLIIDSNPQAAVMLSPNAQHAAAVASLGASEEEIRAAATGSHQKTAAQIDAANKALEAYRKDGVLTEELKSWADDALGTSDVPMELQVEYDQALSSAMVVTGGNADAAIKMAKNKIKSRWGMTSIDGEERLMFNPPEKLLGVRDPVMQQLMEKQVQQTAEALKIPEGKYELEWAGQDKNGTPIYIMKRFDNGFAQTVVDPKTGLPAPFFWDKKALTDELIDRKRKQYEAAGTTRPTRLDMR